jgi:hypothetical protein
VSGQLRAPVALPRGEVPQYTLDRRLVGPRADLDDVERRFELEHLCRPVCSQSLYRLRYPVIQTPSVINLVNEELYDLIFHSNTSLH